jgi:Spy/CpxP family protein refolding chaperone
MADISIARIELKDLLLQDPLDMKAVEAKVRQLGLLRTEMHLAHIKALEMIKAKLTPEQRKKITERMKTGPMMMHE